MNDQRVVLRYRDGRTERVTIDPIDPATERVTARLDDGAVSEVPFGDLKAIFFPQNTGAIPTEASGFQIAVEFADGEVIRGTANYNPERNGFFLYPHDRSKNDRIFVVNSAIVSIDVS